jgi:hypothetical protein
MQMGMEILIKSKFSGRFDKIDEKFIKWNLIGS